MKQSFSPEAKLFLTQLLQRDPTIRLGNQSQGPEANDILEHPFFRNINWNDLRALKLKPPYIPKLAGPEDLTNIDKLFTNEQVQETPDASLTGSNKVKTNFKGFTYD